MRKLILTIFSLLLIHIAFAQKERNIQFPTNFNFRDTTAGFAIDSITTNIGDVPNINRTITKYFKYVGTDTAIISMAWTTDPHFISDYPKEPLLPGRIYSFKVNFWLESGSGPFRKSMGFTMNDGRRVAFIFKGNIVPEKK